MTNNTLISIVGNRPQFIKLAPITHELKKRGYHSTIIHTGQHYDPNLNDIFFEEMEIPKPKYQLAIKSQKHGGMTAEMLENLESLFEKLNPTGILIFGDTNSTLAAALAGVKLKIPMAHVEAGPRIYDIDTPEEINRIVADHGSRFRFCPDITSVQNLARENITQGVYFTGDVMYDAYLHFLEISKKKSTILNRLEINNPFILMTIHRPNNTSNENTLKKLLIFMESLQKKVVFPMHPRFVAAIKKYDLWEKYINNEKVKCIPAVGYLDIVTLLNSCDMVITDSGGLQKEAYFAKKPCGILFYTTPWPEIRDAGWQKVLGTIEEVELDTSRNLLEELNSPRYYGDFFGDGKASKKIIDILEQKEWLRKK